MKQSEASDGHPSVALDAPGPAASSPLRIAITSVFGDPLDPATWSGAPARLARALGALGTEVASINGHTDRRYDLWDALRHLATFGGRPLRRETLMRVPPGRTRRALAVLRETRRLGVAHVLHTGTLDMPVPGNDDGVRHYLYTDHTWNLALRHRPEGRQWPARRLQRIEALEREAYATTRHIFTFGRYVRDDLVDHYGVDPARVTVVGSGMGAIRPYDGPKDYAHGPLLFVAKHQFVEKGGALAVKAFRLARRRRPDLRLIMVGNDGWPAMMREEPGLHVHGRLPADALEALFRSAALLLQPMFNDPWGQVYLEALASRTPVIGLDRNGLPEITENGRHGFLVPVDDPVVLAETIVDAMSDPGRLSRMGESGQRHVLAHYSWDRVASAVSETIGRA